MNWDICEAVSLIKKKIRETASPIREINLRPKQQNRIYGSLYDVKVLC